MGSYTLAFLAPGVIFIYNISIPCPWLQRATGLLLAGTGAAIGLVVPQGGFAYHKATLRFVTCQLLYLLWPGARGMHSPDSQPPLTP